MTGQTVGARQIPNNYYKGLSNCFLDRNIFGYKRTARSKKNDKVEFSSQNLQYSKKVVDSIYLEP